MKTVTILALVLFNLIILGAFSQVSDTIEADKDAMIREYAEEGDNTNYGDYEFINMHSWTNGQVMVVHRSLIHFDLSEIPYGSTIVNAELHLYADPNSTLYPNGHESLTGSNRCFIHRIVTDWEEYSVTWNNQPAITTLNQVEIPQSNYNTQNYEIDITALVQDMLDDTANSFGFLIRQRHEIPYRRMVFASRDNPNQTLRPKLVINFETSSYIGSVTENQNFISVYPNPSNSQINIDFETKENLNIMIKLFDPKGKLVRYKEYSSVKKVRIDINDLSSGFYTLQIFNNHQIYAVRKVLME